jgi:hypothetical protein
MLQPPPKFWDYKHVPSYPTLYHLKFTFLYRYYTLSYEAKILVKMCCWARWYNIPVIPTLWKLGQQDHRIKASLSLSQKNK